MSRTTEAVNRIPSQVSVGTLALLCGCFILSGIAEMVMAFEANGANRNWLLVMGIVSLAIGLIFLLAPRLSLAALVLTTGMGFIVTGAIQVVFGFNLRRHRGDVD